MNFLVLGSHGSTFVEDSIRGMPSAGLDLSQFVQINMSSQRSQSFRLRPGTQHPPRRPRKPTAAHVNGLVAALWAKVLWFYRTLTTLRRHTNLPLNSHLNTDLTKT